MTKMKPRRIGSAFIDLDPLDVIREKDRKSRQASSASNYGHHAPGGTGPNPAAGVTTSGENQAGKSPKTIYIDKPKPTVGVISPENSSKLAAIAHVADATQDAASMQPDVGNVSNSSPGSSNVEKNSKLRLSNRDRDPTSRVMTVLDDAASAATKPPEKLQHGSTAASSRPKRVARKRYTEVDWYEDLRPTDEESSKVDNRHGGSSVSSPEPQSTSSPSKPSLSKRKMRQSASNSSKRRKDTKGKGKAPNKEDPQRLQLPLTAAPATSLVDSLGTNANPSSKNPDMQPRSSDTKRIAKDLLNSLPPKAPEQDLKVDENSAAQLEIIEISSASPLSADELDSDIDMDQATTDVNQAAEAETHGRGRSVGQKLADALRDAGLTTQRQSTTNTGSHLTQTSQWVSMFRETRSPASCASSGNSLQHGALATDFDLAQVQSNPTMTQQGGSEPTEPTTALLDMVPEARLETSSSPVRETTACTDSSPSRESQGLRERSSRQDMAGDKVVVGSRRMTLPDHSKAVPAPELSNNDSKRSIPSHTEEPQAIIQNQKSETEGSSRSSAAAITEGPAALLTGESENENTPESQQPLLTRETPYRPMVMSIPRSSIVDDNGSPRLVERGRAGSLKFGRLLSLAVTDSSPSSHGRTSEDCSGDYTPRDRPSVSKFHLDMLLEYGVEAEDLFKLRSRSALFRSRTTSRGTGIRASRRTEQQPEPRLTTVSPRRTDGSSAVEGKIGDSEQGQASAVAPSSSQRTIDEVGLCSKESSGGHRHPGELLLAETASQFQPSSESPGGTDGMAWISELQTAQRSAHSLLQQTNRVSFAYSNRLY